MLHAPRHPYTIGLMRAMPQPGGVAHRLATIPGRLPDLREPPPGCVFAPRCEIATGLCRSAMPELLVPAGREPDHGSRCHFRDEAEALLPRPPPIAHDKARAGDGRPLLEASGLDKRFGHRSWFRGTMPVRAVHDVTLEIPPGQTLAVVGESGSGKSTLARCVAGLVVPDDGDIRLDEAMLASRVGRRSRVQQRDIQFIFQNPDGALNPHWTVEQLLARPVRLYTGLRGAALRFRVAELLEMVNLEERYLSRYPREMSGGEKQRIGIARAFAGNPRLVVCDEPTSALDISVQAAILNELISLQARHGTAYLFVSHDLGVVHHVAHRVAIMRHGRIVETGSPAEVFERPRDPYTTALIEAIPKLTPIREFTKTSVYGE